MSIGETTPLDQPALWQLVYTTIKPKRVETPNECINRLAKEYFAADHIWLSESSTSVSYEKWPMQQLAKVERHHRRMHEVDDDRPVVILERGARRVVIDGNHRITRWLHLKHADEKSVLVLRA